MSILICDSFDDAIIAYVVKKWRVGGSKTDLGRTMIQKICYFLKARGVPLAFKFDIYHFGPYSQELYRKMDELLADDIICDKSEKKSKSVYVPGKSIEEMIARHNITKYVEDIESIIELFNQFHPTEMELLATTHYLYTTTARYYGKPPIKEEIIEKVINVKRERFTRDVIGRTFDALESNGLFRWNLN